MICIPLNGSNGITFSYTGGRLGDNVMSYIDARWISFTRGIEFYYRPFCYGSEIDLQLSDQLTMYDVHPHFENHTKGKEVIIEDANTIPHEDQDTMFVTGFFLKNNAIDWDNYEFMQIIRKEFTPTQLIKKLSPTKNQLRVALHVRRGGGYDGPLFQTTAFSTAKFTAKDYDIPENDFPDKRTPTRFPPDSWYIEMLKHVGKKFPSGPIAVHIFTDDQRPDLFAEAYANELNDSRFSFSFQTQDNRHDKNVLEDFFSMMEFECVIRASSGFSMLACKIGRPKIELEPIGHTWKGKELHITKTVEIERFDTDTSLKSTRLIFDHSDL